MSGLLGRQVSRAVATLGSLAFGLSVALFEGRLLDSISQIIHRRRGRGDTSGREAGGPQKTGSAIRPAGLPAIRTTSRAASQRPIPIVFIHQNVGAHLAYSLKQARHSNPESSIFLLGDETNNRYAGVEHRNFGDYFAEADAFGRVYTHFSTHTRSFELICFQRWFILKEFLIAHRIEKCVYLDSDVMLYANVTGEIAKFDRFDFTLCWNTIGCVFFLNNRDGLIKLCDFMMDIYTKKSRYHYDRMAAHFAARQHNALPGGACDMTALQLYSEVNFGTVGEASHIIDGSVYDPDINMPNPGFEMADNIKKVWWEGGLPYGTYSRTGEKIRFNSLHFNGRSKALMAAYCTAMTDRRVGTAP
jgi:hypothetical protein